MGGNIRRDILQGNGGRESHKLFFTRLWFGVLCYVDFTISSTSLSDSLNLENGVRNLNTKHGAFCEASLILTIAQYII